MTPINAEHETQVSMETAAIPLPDDPPFHILLLGDYSGRENLANFTDASLPQARPIEVDRDDFEDVLKRLNTSLRLEFEGADNGVLFLQFKELDDFHPDQIFSQIPLFIENTIQVPVVQENSADLSNNLFIESNKIVADNKKINQDIIALELSELSRSPIAISRFYYPSRNKDPEDLQVLS